MLYMSGLPGLAGGSCIIVCKIRMIPVSVQFHVIPNMVHGFAFAVIHLNPCFVQQCGISKGIPLADPYAVDQRFVCISLFNPQIVVRVLVVNHMLHQIIMQRRGFLLIGHIIFNDLGKCLVDSGHVLRNAAPVIL